MKKALVFYVLFLLAFNCYAIAQEKRSQAIQEESSAFIPAAWLGNWRGEVTPQSTSGDGDKFQMELEVAPLPEKDRVKWKITYRGAQGESVRDYQLLADKNKAGHYVIDEGNGIRIPATLLGNTLQSHFSIGGQTIWTCYELVNGEPNSLVFELVTADDKQPVMSGGEKDTPQVTGLIPTSRQVARLVRQSETPKLSGGNATLVQWQKLNTDRYRGKQDDIYFVNDRVGWYGNGAGKIYKTDDGGQTWIKQLDQAGTYFRCLAFIDEQHGFAGNIGPGYFPNVSDTNPLYETKDSGQTWSAVRSKANRL